MAAKDFNPALGRMVGIGGDYNIVATATTPSALTFSHVLFTADSVIDDIKLNGASCKTARNYIGTIPQGYIACAGGDNVFTYVKLTSGSAEGIIFSV